VRENVYTLARWRVKPGKEEEFVAAWKALGAAFARLPTPPADRGTLVRSTDEPELFYSFGPWRTLDDVRAMRESASAREGFERLRDLCTEATPGTFQVVAESQ
jgi:heme-degrading monooxygenase HmoA